MTSGVRYYKIIGGQITLCKSEQDYVNWRREYPEERIIKKTEIGNYVVSTVFLGYSIEYAPYSKPLLFETMILNSATQGEFLWDYCERSSTLEEAQEHHLEAVIMCEREIAEANLFVINATTWTRNTEEQQ